MEDGELGGMCRVTFELQKIFTLEQVQSFLKLTGDTNPIHYDPEAAKAQGALFS